MKMNQNFQKTCFIVDLDPPGEKLVVGRDTVHIAATNSSLHPHAILLLTGFYALQNHRHMHYVKSLKHKSRVSSPLHYQVIGNLRLRGVTELSVVT